ncbi:1852_t:CDS:2 [Ambispora leptoticha]|uniref:1852_t:CDS:1 n=1 Tax=Ambispora leptoticha TaxID=144679 RepID=A0A9N9FWY6_9GLOM|nr:1852_t:CDS:2 [Ambispora leptoticha]
MAGGTRYDRDRGRDRERESGSSRRAREENSPASGEVGREFANRYGGLFSEKDWKCSICSNINWARRNECNQCKTPKPGLETTLGSREGRGGGFLERDEVIEYRQSRDAEKDDEWDEFGRKKKKKLVITALSAKMEMNYLDELNDVKDRKNPQEDSDLHIVVIVHYRGMEDPDEAGQRQLNEQTTDLVPGIIKDMGMMIAEDQDLILAIKEDRTEVDQGQAHEIESDPIIEADHEIVITESTFGKGHIF